MSGKTFPGFPSRGKYTPLHNVFFTEVLPGIRDLAELKATLHVLRSLYLKKGYPRLVTRRELLEDRALMRGLEDGEGAPAAQALDRGLAAAVERGTLLHLRLERRGRVEDVYLSNTGPDRLAAERLARGDLPVDALVLPAEDGSAPPQKDNIFSLYESNIGLLTPMIAEELKEAEQSYPEQWVRDAFREAVALNKRSWRYIARILQRWSVEGRGHGTPGRPVEKTDPDKYIRGKYGHVVRRS